MSRDECALCNRTANDSDNKGTECAKEAILGAVRAFLESFKGLPDKPDKDELERAAKSGLLTGLLTLPVEFLYCYYSSKKRAISSVG